MSALEKDPSSSDTIDSPHSCIFISRQPPENVFSDEWFEVGFNLSQSFPESIDPESIELCANLYRNTNEKCELEPVKQSDDNIIGIDLAMQSTTTNSTLPGQSSVVKCKIVSPALLQDGQAVFYNIKFFQRMKESGDIIDQVEGVVSRKVHIVKFKLSLECNWGHPVVFYKDEGGKDKHLKTVATLYRSDNCIEKGIHVPLKVSLIYDNEEGSNVLKESEILRFLDGSKHYIDPDTGQSIIKFRIEDVSKNHQGLKFKLLVSPMGDRSNHVGNVATPGIAVRSKRNKRSLDISSPPRKKILQHIIQSPESIAQTEGGAFSTPSRDIQSFKCRPEDMDLNMAIGQLSEWTSEVTRILPTLNWTLIGYCQNADGSVDYTKPNHLMPYPNDCIKRLMKAYSSNISSCLDIIQQGIKNVMRRNGDLVGRGNPLFEKTMEINPGSPPILQTNPTIEAKQGYNDLTFPSILPTPITPMLPVRGLTNAINDPNQNIREDRMRSTPQNEKGRSGNTLDPHEYNDLLKKIEFILARHFHTISGEKLGFPVCDMNKDLLGFFRESEMGEGCFYPMATIENFDSRQASEIKRVLEEAINQSSDAVHRLQDCGSLVSLFDHAMVYDWSREFSQHT